MEESREREKRISVEDVDIPVEGSEEEKHTGSLKGANSITPENFGGNAIPDDFGRFEEIRTNERIFACATN